MKRSIAAVLFLLFSLNACSENAVFEEARSVYFSDAVYVLDSLSDDFENLIPADSLFLDSGKSIRLRVITRINDSILAVNELKKHFFIRYWTYAGNTRGEETFQLSFAGSGEYELCHVSVDFFGDSLTVCLPVFVNEKLSLQSVSPENKTNNLDIKKDTLLFTWNFNGIDSWEKATCRFYLAKASENLWETKYQTVACQEPLSIALKKLQGIVNFETEDSPAFIWGIRAETQAGSFSEKLNAGPFQFRFISRSETAALLIPIRYENAQRRSHKQGRLEVKIKDSVLVTKTFGQDTLFELKKLPVNQPLKILVRETLLKDYVEDSTETILRQGIYQETDTLVLQDKQAPEAFPLKQKFSTKEPIAFYVTENGSGINALRTSVLEISGTEFISHPYVYSESQMFFKMPCDTSCLIRVVLQDNALNKSPDKLWKLSFVRNETKTPNEKNVDSVLISGPYFFYHSLTSSDSVEFVQISTEQEIRGE